MKFLKTEDTLKSFSKHIYVSFLQLRWLLCHSDFQMLTQQLHFNMSALPSGISSIAPSLAIPDHLFKIATGQVIQWLSVDP